LEGHKRYKLKTERRIENSFSTLKNYFLQPMPSENLLVSTHTFPAIIDYYGITLNTNYIKSLNNTSAAVIFGYF